MQAMLIYALMPDICLHAFIQHLHRRFSSWLPCFPYIPLRLTVFTWQPGKINSLLTIQLRWRVN